jgi:hypothetical protein
MFRRRSAPYPGDEPQLLSEFANHAGQYQLVRVDGDQARYIFTNRQGLAQESAMPVATWRRLSRAFATG